MAYEKQYYDLSHEAGYAGARNLVRVNKKKGKPNEKARIYAWLSNQDAYTLHHPIKRKFPRLRYNVTNVDDVWECDLLQLTSIKDYNDGFCYILVVVDVLSKYAWIEPLRDKTARNVASAFEKILDRANPRVPVYLQSDRGKEFVGSAFQNILKKNNIQFRVARNPDIKAAIVERLNRTLRERIWRYFTRQNTKRYVDVVQKIIYAYNHTLHSGTRMKPSEVNLYNAVKARENLQRRMNGRKRAFGATAKFKVGDFVRISRTKNTFERGYEKNFSEEVFKIQRISRRQNLYTYILEDLNGEIIDGFFYTEELVLVGRERIADNQKFKVEQVVRTRGRGANKQVLVKWLGYSDKFNSWIKASELERI